MTGRCETAERYEIALRDIIALVPGYEESWRVADDRRLLDLAAHGA